MPPNRSKRILVKTVAFLLFFAVAGLSTLAKQSKYLRESNPLSHFSQSTKMELVHHSFDYVPATTGAASRIVFPQPEFSSALPIPPDGLTLHQIELAVCFQHRAPPSLAWFAGPFRAAVTSIS